MRWLFALVFAAALSTTFDAHAQRAASDYGQEVADFRAAVRLWDAQTWQVFIAQHPDGPNADLARAALTTLDPTAPARSADDARAALDRYTTADWNCADMPTLVGRMAPGIGVGPLQALAESGDARAETLIGWSMTEGYLGLRSDYGRGVRMLRHAADQGFAPAQSNMGDRQIEARPREFVRLNRAAAEAGNSCGQVGLGIAYYRGMGGVQRDYAEAARLYRLAADQGNAFGQTNLAGLTIRGLGGLTADAVEAARLFRLAAEQGNAAAQNALGVMYRDGRGGLTVDREEARRLFVLGAAQGNELARTNLEALASAPDADAEPQPPAAPDAPPARNP